LEIGEDLQAGGEVKRERGMALLLKGGCGILVEIFVFAYFRFYIIRYNYWTIGT
jgi:hypothetical protein